MGQKGIYAAGIKFTLRVNSEGTLRWKESDGCWQILLDGPQRGRDNRASQKRKEGPQR